MIKYVAIFAMMAGLWFHGDYHGGNTERLKWQDKVQEATEKARQTEKTRQDKINEALQEQYDGLAIINSNLVSDIDGLRNRPPRRSLPGNTTVNCEGATGADLSRPDAEAFIRLSARADRLRDALKTCYAYADALITDRK